jgi:hypothetical protein
MNKFSFVLIGTVAVAGLFAGCGAAPEDEIEQVSSAHTTPPPPEYPPPLCEASVQPQDVYCMDHVISGGPKAECKQFRLDSLGKDDELSGLSFTASRDAYVAIVKSGSHGCKPGATAYRIYVDVKAGDTLLTPADQDISHITYCACPTNYY